MSFIVVPVIRDIEVKNSLTIAGGSGVGTVGRDDYRNSILFLYPRNYVNFLFSYLKKFNRVEECPEDITIGTYVTNSRIRGKTTSLGFINVIDITASKHFQCYLFICLKNPHLRAFQPRWRHR